MQRTKEKQERVLGTILCINYGVITWQYIITLNSSVKKGVLIHITSKLLPIAGEGNEQS